MSTHTLGFVQKQLGKILQGEHLPNQEVINNELIRDRMRQVTLYVTRFEKENQEQAHAIVKLNEQTEEWKAKENKWKHDKQELRKILAGLLEENTSLVEELQALEEEQEIEEEESEQNGSVGYYSCQIL